MTVRCRPGAARPTSRTRARRRRAGRGRRRSRCACRAPRRGPGPSSGAAGRSMPRASSTARVAASRRDLRSRFFRAQAGRAPARRAGAHGATVRRPARARRRRRRRGGTDRGRRPRRPRPRSRTPSAISVLTASTSSYSPRTERVTCRQAAWNGRRHPPAGHADEPRSPSAAVCSGVGFSTMRASRPPSTTPQREGADPFGGDVALRQQRSGDSSAVAGSGDVRPARPACARHSSCRR